MTEDPIVREIHRTRKRLMDECGGDLEKLCERLKAAEATHPERLVSPATRRKKAPTES